MSRCKHPQVTISEAVEAIRQFNFTDGRLDVYGSVHQPSKGRLLAHCHDCHLTRYYSVGSWPKWVRKLMEAIPKELR